MSPLSCPIVKPNFGAQRGKDGIGLLKVIRSRALNEQSVNREKK